MNIKSITIGGFKNIASTKIALDKIVVLVSPNNYGKSNLIEAINFGVDFLTAGKKNRKAMMKWLKGIPLVSSLAQEDFRFELEFDDPELGEYRHVKYGFSFSWFRDDGTGQRITDEWLEARKTESIRYSSFIRRNDSKYRKSYSTTAYRNVLLDESQLAIDVISSIENIDIADVVKSIQNVKCQICSSLDMQARFTPSAIEFIYTDDGDAHIDFDDEDLPKALFNLRKSHPEKYTLFREAFFTLFPEFTDFSLQSFELKDEQTEKLRAIISERENNKDGANYPIPFQLKEEMHRMMVESEHINQPINASLMSTGTKRIVWLLANIFMSNCSGISLLGIEEIETSIHPRQLKKLLEILINSQGNTKIIASSHSPFIIQYLKLEQIYIGLPGGGTATFRNVSDSKTKNLRTASRNLGVSAGEYLFELMSGGSDSANILNQYLEVM